MFCKDIANFAVTMETCDPWILAKRATFLRNILWESCSKFHFKHFCCNMSYLNIISLAVILIIKSFVNLIKIISKFFFLKHIFVQNFFTKAMKYVITDGSFLLPTLESGVPCAVFGDFNASILDPPANRKMAGWKRVGKNVRE